MNFKIWGNHKGPELKACSGVPKGRSEAGECPYCSTRERTIYHRGACPHVRRIEYWPDGSIRAIEYKGGHDVR